MADVVAFIIAGLLVGILVGYWLTQRRRRSGTVDVSHIDGENSGYGYCPGCGRERRLTAWVDGRWACSEHLTSERIDGEEGA